MLNNSCRYRKVLQLSTFDKSFGSYFARTSLLSLKVKIWKARQEAIGSLSFQLLIDHLLFLLGSPRCP